ncbi:phosphopantetheine-binding protein [Micromonospora sp. CPCC 206060]|uniref:phosphopantetheine-binding protein n=1 Tax=Micromonospora sp. CPCC 206060 TaxID=3122406 RepID=UPI002FEF5137
MNEDVIAVVSALVSRRSSRTDGAAVRAEGALTDLGFDSLGVVGLLMDIEETFSVRFPADQITPEVFHSVDSIVTAVTRLRGRSS